ncbi:MAG: hypothetical protein KDD45_09425, partial [Bdellovibrionales bacterium]|nr:hypothetical protein [Bdellovibrionales bacterium]
LRIKERNPSVNLEIDGEILKLFQSQFKDKSGLLDGTSGGLANNLQKVYGFYDSFLGNLGGSSLTREQQLMYTAALEERLLISSLIE